MQVPKPLGVTLNAKRQSHPVTKVLDFETQQSEDQGVRDKAGSALLDINTNKNQKERIDGSETLKLPMKFQQNSILVHESPQRLKSLENFDKHWKDLPGVQNS